MTLVDMAAAENSHFGVRVCGQTAKNAVDGLRYTVKAIHQQTSNMNSTTNKEKRLNYLIKLV